MNGYSKLVNKYNISIPRYTSYPPVPFWKEKIQEKNWINYLQKSYQPNLGVDLYVHVPYCESLCYYCGCNRTITKDHSLEDIYLKAVKKEWELYQEKFNFPLNISSLHFGGGTPTFLSSENLNSLITFLLSSKSEHFIGSIEIDPRTCQDDHLTVLREHGFSRISLGIQDFDANVQTAINRHQTPKQIEILVNRIRNLNFESINFDLIYGLPKQSIHSIEYTMTIVNSLRPDLIAFYSYAHLPEKIKNQRLINNADLPTVELKHELFSTGSNILKKNEYYNIGMDHFGLPHSYLYQAKIQKKLNRSFMGYTDKKSPQLIGLGPTSISDSSLCFMQNLKDVKQYLEKIDNNELPIDVGHVLTEKDQQIRHIIQTIMCNYHVDLNQYQNIPFYDEIKVDLQQFQNDGIIKMENEECAITEMGAPFVRNVAMSFDYHLRNSKNNTLFSKSI